MENLISMTDFVLAEARTNSAEQEYFLISRYADFLKQPLELWMFVPCVDNEVFNYSKHGNKEQYNEAKERCLFEGCVYDDEMEMVRSHIGDDVFYIPDDSKRTIERVVIYKLKLTETAKNIFI